MTEFPARIDCGDFVLEKIPATFENAARLFDVVDKNREYLGAWLGWVRNIRAPEDEFLPLRHVGRLDTPAYFIVIDGAPVGAVDGHGELVHDLSIEMGYWLSREYSGRGIATRAARQMADLLFERGYNRIVIHAATENMPSIKVATRLGFVREGIMRASMQICPGEFQDMVLLSKLKSEWVKDKSNA